MVCKEEDFLKRQFFKISWSASTQRNPTYKKATPQVARTAFMENIEHWVTENIDPEYSKNVSEERHYEKIKALMDYGTQAGRGILSGGIYKSANAQKLLNVYLKFLWCAGLIPRPPHCPVDAIVLRAAGLYKERWTELKTLEEYRKIIELLKVSAGTKPLAEWELDVYEENA